MHAAFQAVLCAVLHWPCYVKSPPFEQQLESLELKLRPLEAMYQTGLCGTPEAEESILLPCTDSVM